MPDFTRASILAVKLAAMAVAVGLLALLPWTVSANASESRLSPVYGAIQGLPQASGCSPQDPDPSRVRALASHDLPHVFIGQATLNGQPVEAGTEITAWEGDYRIGLTQAREDGKYTLQTSRARDSVTFKVDGWAAGIVYENWVSGEITNGFELAATRLLNCFEGEVTTVSLSEALGGQLRRIFAFDNVTKEWSFYDSAIGDESTLSSLVPGRPYFMLVTAAMELNSNGVAHRLSCVEGNCWNSLVW